MIFIKNGYLVNPKMNFEGLADILIEDGRIKNIYPDGTKNPVLPAGAEVVDAQGLTVAPGLVDIHVHFRDPGFTYKEDIYSGAGAAARGGYTTVVLMANTKPAVDNEETLHYVLAKGKETDIHIESCAAVTRGLQGKKLVFMDTLKKAGAVGFTDDGVPLLEEKLLREAMLEARDLDMPISVHEEDPEFIYNNGINAGYASACYNIPGSFREAEISLVKRDLDLALETGAVLNIQHISTKEAVELVREAKKRGDNIHAEATPHHFSLNETAVAEHGALAKMNPPLREEEDRLAIIQGLKDGTIDIIATDHAPHSSEEKAKSITEAPSGIIGLETALSLGITNLVEKKQLTMYELIERMSAAPAQLYHLDAGYVTEGGPADLVLFDGSAKWTAGEYRSKSCNSPFTGQTLSGVVKYTICAGKIIYRG